MDLSELLTCTVFYVAGGDDSVDVLEMALRMAHEPNDTGMFSSLRVPFVT